MFKHLISLGYIDLMECEECKAFLAESLVDRNTADIVDISSKQWYWQNPFQANREEYQIIFDVKDIIDTEYFNGLSSTDLVGLINDRGYNAQALVKNKVGLSVKNLMSAKRLKMRVIPEASTPSARHAVTTPSPTLSNLTNRSYFFRW